MSLVMNGERNDAPAAVAASLDDAGARPGGVGDRVLRIVRAAARWAEFGVELQRIRLHAAAGDRRGVRRDVPRGGLPRALALRQFEGPHADRPRDAVRDGVAGGGRVAGSRLHGLPAGGLRY